MQATRSPTVKIIHKDHRCNKNTSKVSTAIIVNMVPSITDAHWHHLAQIIQHSHSPRYTALNLTNGEW